MKDLLFAGSTVGEPWWTCGEIAAAVLKPIGYNVTVTAESASHKNIPYVSKGTAQIGATVPRHFAAARDKKGLHAESDITRLRAIATVSRPNWVALAIRRDLGVSGVRELVEQRFPMRIVAGGAERGGELSAVLGYFGTSIDEVTGWGGKHHRWSGRMGGTFVREGDFDLMLGNIYAGYTPHNRFWYEATVLHDMQFLDLEPELRELLTRDFGYTLGTIPHGLFPGVDRDIPSVQQSTIIYYCRDDLDAKIALDLARELDKNSDLFMQVRSPLYYERHKIGINPFIPLHPAVEEYYRAQGYPVSYPGA